MDGATLVGLMVFLGGMVGYLLLDAQARRSRVGSSVAEPKVAEPESEEDEDVEPEDAPLFLIGDRVIVDLDDCRTRGTVVGFGRLTSPADPIGEVLVFVRPQGGSKGHSIPVYSYDIEPDDAPADGPFGYRTSAKDKDQN
jgi:hypothetical protein